MDFTILFEDTEWVAIDKPSGVLSVRSRLGDQDPRQVAAVEVEKKRGKIWPVHRLDLEVSGILLLAKTAEAHRRGNLAFESGEVTKTYEALTDGQPPKTAKAVWKSTLLRGKKRAYESEHGKSATTEAEFKEKSTWNGEAALRWELNPQTGRSHQLRYELAKHGYPILGDSLYGSQRPFEPHTIALRAVRLKLGKLEIEAPKRF